MSDKDQIFSKALKMPPADRAKLVDKLLQSLDKPDYEIDRQWIKESEDRIDAFEAGDIQTVNVEEVLKKYKDV